jgi:hydroxymethylpyrimidine/phosphomethylpyrimidine kinase
VPTVLSIGTTHPANVAGVGRDLVVGRELGCDVIIAVAAVSAQNEGLRLLHVLPAAALRAQLDALEEVRASAVRVGALGSAENVALVAEYLERRRVVAVVDPVRATSSGQPLIDEEGYAALGRLLATMPLVVLTPNLPEAAELLGHPQATLAELDATAAALHARGARAVLLKGGHLDGDPIDVLATANGTERFEDERVETAMRGRGCTLAMALACGLADGSALREAVIGARAFVRAKMRQPVRE